MMHFPHWKRMLAISLSGIALAACTGGGEPPTPAQEPAKEAVEPEQAAVQQPEEKEAYPKDSLEYRAVARWQARIDEDWDAAYEFLSPAMRAVKPKQVHRAQAQTRSLLWRDAEFGRKSCKPGEGEIEETCRVIMKVTSLYMGVVDEMRGQESVDEIIENWVKSNGSWWYLPDA